MVEKGNAFLGGRGKRAILGTREKRLEFDRQTDRQKGRQNGR
jgi:hypothetical protein